MPEPARFCLRGHDTAVVGRNSSRTCRACARESATATYRAEEAVRRAELAEAHRREKAQREREQKRWRASLRGPALLEQLEREAQQDLRCPWDVSRDPPKVCGKKIRGEGAGVWRFYCAHHDRQADR